MRPLDARLRQPDARSCGAACVVMARALADPAYAAEVASVFATDVRATHRRLTSARLRGRWQLPWPQALGTPPWAVARELSALTGVRHRVRVVRWSRSTSPAPGALYVGSRWLPRHVVLVLGGSPARCYEPSSGRVLPIARDLYLDGAVGLAGWPTPWMVITPD